MPKSKVGRFGPEVFSLIRAEVVRGEARGVGWGGGLCGRLLGPLSKISNSLVDNPT